MKADLERDPPKLIITETEMPERDDYTLIQQGIYKFYVRRLEPKQWYYLKAQLSTSQKPFELNPNLAVAYNNRADAYRVLGKKDLTGADKKKVAELEK